MSTAARTRSSRPTTDRDVEASGRPRERKAGPEQVLVDVPPEDGAMYLLQRFGEPPSTFTVGLSLRVRRVEIAFCFAQARLSRH